MQTVGSFVTLLLAVTFEGRCPFEECVVAGGSGDLHKAWKEPVQAQGGMLLLLVCTKSTQGSAHRNLCCDVCTYLHFLFVCLFFPPNSNSLAILPAN